MWRWLTEAFVLTALTSAQDQRKSPSWGTGMFYEMPIHLLCHVPDKITTRYYCSKNLISPRQLMNQVLKLLFFLNGKLPFQADENDYFSFSLKTCSGELCCSYSVLHFFLEDCKDQKRSRRYSEERPNIKTPQRKNLITRAWSWSHRNQLSVAS